MQELVDFPIRAYYKGSTLPAAVDDTPEKFNNNIKRAAKFMIVDFLRKGYSLQEQIDDMRGKLDRIESDMCKITKMKPFAIEQFDQCL